MELTVLGRWAAFPAAGGACSGYLVQHEGYSVVVDCGHGVMSNLQALAQPGQINAVLLSHLHPDHWHDLTALRHALRAYHAKTGSNVLLPLVCPGQPTAPFDMIRSYAETFQVRAVEELPESLPVGLDGEPGRAIQLGPFQICFYPTRHGLPAYCLRLSTGEKTLFYTGDTALTTGLPAQAQGADLLLCEATIPAADRPLMPDDHLAARDAGLVAEKAGAGRLVLTHFWPYCEPEVLLAEAGQQYSGQLDIAVEGRVFTL